jgi:hypothetical protein
MDDLDIPPFLDRRPGSNGKGSRNPPNPGQYQAPNADASMESWALHYANRGWSVVPLHSAVNGPCSCGDPNCGAAGKHPRTQNGVKDASTHLQQISRWWKQWPDANVGIATGAVSGILVVEIDPSKGGDGSYQQLQIDLPGAFAAPLKVRTGSSGTHLYFECLKATPSRANIRPGIDVKADSGYVVAPSSLHVSGGRYHFVSNSRLVPPPLPIALHDLIVGGAPADASGAEMPQVKPDSLRTSDKIDDPDGQPKGQRSEAISAGVRPKPDQDGPAASAPGTAASAPGTAPALISRLASQIQPEAIRWLWPQRIARGKTSLIAGPPGLGKSQVTIYLAAITSKGGTWPTGEVCAAGDVLIFSAEDDPADTIRPRLEACGANLDRIHVVEAVRHNQLERTFNLKHHLGALAAKLKTTPDAKLVIIDPISSYLGGVDSHNNVDVRAVLAPLAKLAADHGVAVVCVTHLNKGTSDDPLTRVIGSTAFGAAVRTAFLITPDKANPDRRLFLPVKTNISRNCDGLAFRVEAHVLPSGIATSRVAWEAGSVKMTASEALSPSTRDEIDEAKEVAEACLRVFGKGNATELRASDLINLLAMHETRSISAKQLKKSLKLCGIDQHKRSDANYYLKADFSSAP